MTWSHFVKPREAHFTSRVLFDPTALNWFALYGKRLPFSDPTVLILRHWLFPISENKQYFYFSSTNTLTHSTPYFCFISHPHLTFSLSLSEIYCCSENLARFFSLIFQVWIFLEKAFLFRFFFLSYFHFLFWVGCLLMFFLFKWSLSIFVRFTF